ncbi:MAG: glutamate formimidoyltransferase [Chloroflexi bacterium]|nr:glutamate formimidoyltransferase [Chloroflexota bacterium]
MPRIVECIPNFSEGRRTEVIEAIAAAIRSVPGIRLLGTDPDPDHNRTVITFVGEPEPVEEAAFQAMATAQKHINLDHHHGEHPRIGATDVCPFVPVSEVTTAECVAMARRLGERVGRELGICVYLYGEAATRPEREKLSDIRKGEYELWQKEVATNPARQPDFGPAEAKPWGATVIGARPFLIAYNLYLNTDKVEIAKKIAAGIRFTGGGFRYVQALGFLVEGQAQVSMNLTNFEKTPIYRVQELVKREAAQYGLTVTKAELVGLTPQKALLDTAKWYLQLDGLKDDQVLELRMAQVEATANGSGDELTPHAFIEAVASNQPAPGGGAVAALAGALAAALAQMVAGLTIGRKKYADVNEQAQAVLASAELLRLQLTKAVREDAAAFEQVMAAMRNKSLPEAERQAAIEQATIGAAEVPLRVARLSLEAAKLARQMASVGNVNAATDAAAGGIMARAAAQVASLNVKTNAVSLQDQTLAQAWRDELAQIESDIAQLADEITHIAAERGGF